MKGWKNKKGVLTIEACISYTIFLMIIVSMLYIMRIVYAYGLIQHAVSQTAKELSMYTYIYQVTGMNDAYQSIQNSTSGRKEQFNQDAENVISLYEALGSGIYNGQGYSGTTNPTDILKNVGSALLSEAAGEANQQLFEKMLVRPMISGYIGADSNGLSAGERLKALRIEGGMDGLDLSSSSFFEDGVTVDLVVCYTIDPLIPIDVMPELNLTNRACVRGMSGKSVFTRQSDSKQEQSVWDKKSDVERGRAIQSQENVRNLPDHFPVYSAYDSRTGKATAERSIDLREESYQDYGAIKSVIRSKCGKMENYRKATYGGMTLDPADITGKELILYIPSSTEERDIDRGRYDQALKEVQAEYPDIHIVTREID